MKNTAIIFFILLFVCADAKAAEDEYPISAAEQREQRVGSVVSSSDEGGIDLFGSSGKGKAAKHSKHMPVNTFLWQAALEVLRFMPIVVSDSSGGVISTDWYEDEDISNTQYKINVIISSSELRSDAIQVNVFKKEHVNGRWLNKKPSADLARNIEEQIITKARELKMANSLPKAK